MPQPTVPPRPHVAGSADLDDLHRAVVTARRDILHGRPPGITAAAASPLFSGLFEHDIDQLAGTALGALLELAPELAGREGFTDDALGVVLDALDGAFWLALTAGHVRVCGEVSVPRRLFPPAA